MERWAANTLRTIGIVLTSGFVLIVALLTALLCLCASALGTGNSRDAATFMELIALGVVLIIGGITFIVWLVHSMDRSIPQEPFPALATSPSTPAVAGSHDLAVASPGLQLHLSPLGRKAVDRLIFAMGAQIVVSALAWVIGQLTVWTRPHQFAPHNWTLLLLAPFVLYHLPYAILIYVLIKRPGRGTFTYSVAVPSVLILQALFSLTVVTFYYVHQPVGFVLLFVPWAIHIVILILAYKAIEQVGLHPRPGALMIDALITFLYFTAIHGLTPLLYRNTWR